MQKVFFLKLADVRHDVRKSKRPSLYDVYIITIYYIIREANTSKLPQFQAAASIQLCYKKVCTFL